MLHHSNVFTKKIAMSHNVVLANISKIGESWWPTSNLKVGHEFGFQPNIFIDLPFGK